MRRVLSSENILLEFVLVGCGLLAATGCTFTYSPYLKYTPTANPAQVADTKSAPVQVDVTDSRQTNVVMILSAKNRSGYHEFDVDIRKGELIPANDPAEMLKDAFRTELKSRGFAIGSGGNVILINLSSWHGEYFVTTPWSGSAIASMELDVTIKRADGSVVFKRSISGGSASWLAAHPPPQGENKPVAEAAEAALQQVVANVLSDPQFLDALKQ